LDAFNLVTQNEWIKDGMQRLLETTAVRMISWLQMMSFKSGDIPMVNDSAPSIAPGTKELTDYAARLSIGSAANPLKESGYRKFTDNFFEVFFDAGQISPSYQPGHSHADNLNFIFHYAGKPIVVDTGISTYEKNGRRFIERSTSSHNTVTINGNNSSEVWGGFRVGRRAKTTITGEGDRFIEAFHDGYKSYGITHKRRVELEKSILTIQDVIEGKIGKNRIKGCLHFHPSVKIESHSEGYLINGQLLFSFKGHAAINQEEYLFAEGFNKLQKAYQLIYHLQSDAGYSSNYCAIRISLLKE